MFGSSLKPLEKDLVEKMLDGLGFQVPTTKVYLSIANKDVRKKTQQRRILQLLGLPQTSPKGHHPTHKTPLTLLIFFYWRMLINHHLK